MTARQLFNLLKEIPENVLDLPIEICIHGTMGSELHDYFYTVNGICVEEDYNRNGDPSPHKVLIESVE